MTVQDAINRADAIAPNQYTAEQKLRWLSDYDGKIYYDVILTHLSGPVPPPPGPRRDPLRPTADWWEPPPPPPPGPPAPPWTGYEDGSAELLVQAPYGADLYVNYLLSRVAEANAEIAKYNQYAALTNRAYDEWTAHYNRTHPPVPSGRWRY